MYKQREDMFKLSFEESFTEITELLEQIIGFELKAYDIELDLTKTHQPSWACLWNDINNRGKNCMILCCNDKIALVIFDGEDVMDFIDDHKERCAHLYRLEDLIEQ